MNKTILRLGRAGHSMRAISRETGCYYGKVFRVLVDAGIRQYSPKKAKNGYAFCNKCRKRQPISEFPKLRFGGDYVCACCVGAYYHEYQIARHGCSVLMYRTLFEKQKGKCAICGRRFGHIARSGNRARLAVDHDHKTGQIRGLLCGRCNRGLGWFRDNLKLIKKAVEYLERSGSG